MLEGSVEAYALPRLIRPLLRVRTIFIPVGRALGNTYRWTGSIVFFSLSTQPIRSRNKELFARPVGTLLAQKPNFRESALDMIHTLRQLVRTYPLGVRFKHLLYPCRMYLVYFDPPHACRGSQNHV